ncbi:hypothetical protein GSI_14607 [Ganoderma sinense ZZ0214-1]|uniref:DUF7729 domain-containing protein n=1 Tax=Ganoderma sinense ZZ0214-1 TaxID=1077348 RepID=A0A2G8RP74_9APHY|nr:hypothetical protein GSI_14607 [Ganoderma sinense ZZ0214-1]
MFTPPPSPDPRRPQPSSRPERLPLQRFTLDSDSCDDPFLSPSPGPSRRCSLGSQPSPPVCEPALAPEEDPYLYSLPEKKRIGRRIRWTAVLVPLILIFVAFSTRYLTHPAAFHVLSPSHSSSWVTVQDWTPHKRHAAPDPLPATSGIATTVHNGKPTGSSLSVAASSAPTSASAAPTTVAPANTKVPSSPPVLPTPFPQAFDSSFSTSFQTVACENFMTNMTQTLAFRQCRPFSLLVGDSNAFITSQRNISELNVIIWGTCNTDLSAVQCASNMQWFSQNIQPACKQDIAAKNSIVTDAVAGLEAYSVLREAACQVDTQTDTYCYVEAAQSAHTADLYLYQLPLGLPLPNSSVTSCTSCVQSLMSAYAKDAGSVAGFKDTYAPAANMINSACGSTFVSDVASTPSGAQAQALVPAWMGATALAVGPALLALW